MERKVLCGILAMGGLQLYDGLETYLPPEEWFDFCFYEENCKYYFEFETFLHFDTPAKCQDYISLLASLFRDWMIKHGYDTTGELNLYETLTEGYGANSTFDDIETSYKWFKQMARGFKGDGI